MARVSYKGFDLPDGTETPNVPGDLTTLVDGIPRGRIAGDSNGSQVDGINPAVTLASINVTVAFTRYVQIVAYINGGQVTTAAGIANGQVSGLPGLGTMYAAYRNNLASGDNLVGTGIWVVSFPVGTTAVTLKAFANAGALRVAAGNGRLSALELGPAP